MRRPGAWWTTTEAQLHKRGTAISTNRIKAGVLAAATVAGLALTTAPADAADHCKAGGGGVYICQYGVTKHKLPDGGKQQFLVGTDNAVWTRWTDSDGDWTHWSSMGGTARSEIVVIDRFSGGDPWQFSLSVEGNDGWRFVKTRHHDGSWTDWYPMPDPV
ncbi:hypothetical protein ACFVHW_21130 [Streptomyces sp. NPDC127110]|uniref:hypothetical protein n=1 Tax=Streptomyces sp. NPDC127110 TaxID=3345362 RepID=UPI00362C3EEE